MVSVCAKVVTQTSFAATMGSAFLWTIAVTATATVMKAKTNSIVRTGVSFEILETTENLEKDSHFHRCFLSRLF